MQLEMVELGMTGGSALGVMLVVWLFRSHTRGEPLQTRRSERDDSLNLDPQSQGRGGVEAGRDGGSIVKRLCVERRRGFLG